MYPAASHKTSNQKVDSSQVFEKQTRQKQPKIINKITKSWVENQNEGLDYVGPKQDHIVCLLIVVAKDKFN